MENKKKYYHLVCVLLMILPSYFLVSAAMVHNMYVLGAGVFWFIGWSTLLFWVIEKYKYSSEQISFGLILTVLFSAIWQILILFMFIFSIMFTFVKLSDFLSQASK